MFGPVQRTPFDLRFGLFGVPVTVHPFFWLVSALLGWAPGRPDLTIVWIACVFVSILVHELGHALMTRRYGWQPEIVLHSFGGYATTMRHSTWRNVAVLAAGPGAGFLLFAAVVAIQQLQRRFGLQSHELADVALAYLWFINLVWGLVNLLLPVFPLDGGQIAREILAWFDPRRGEERALLLSIAVSGGIALWSLIAALDRGAVWYPLGSPRYVALMFGYLCFLNVQMRNSRRQGPW